MMRVYLNTSISKSVLSGSVVEKSWENESKYKGGCQVHVPQNEKTNHKNRWITDYQ